ncbi:NAD-dependent epimerase/dehydratase family protein [Streptomyces sp. SID3343]|uniref:NAD-dependent epimerase/dehydratase family protein n=1 Tax=Streptomyces sp. SID3343 TaxID=2690260 RepID=UPI00136ED749|nr:NAD-dependent epimerase/dehydratase family protein [Streptomyces sp. SID3343]MYW05095.1 NAD-dependent epimerase/dehydratase family protein [Streptomyces sp. SID3343]
MRLLILGGTAFVGRAILDDALARGWDVTVFNRGKNELPTGVRALHGDRTAEGGLAALEHGEWDIAVDTWSAAPRAVRDTTRLLADRVGRYAYVSTCSVYAYPTPVDGGEDAPLVTGASPDDGGVEYALAKRGAEIAVEQAFGDRHVLARPGLILGPRENIGRLPYWLNRIARGGPVLAPSPRDLPVQYIDARDLAAWTLDAAEAGLTGGYNVIGPTGHATLGEILDLCVRVTGSDAELRWTDPERILAAGIEPWVEMPIWLPAGEDYDHIHRRDVRRALATGLRVRPVEETVADTWDWLRSGGRLVPAVSGRSLAGLPPEKEAAVLAG